MKRLSAYSCLATGLIAFGLLLFPGEAGAQAPGKPVYGNNVTAGLDAWRSGGYKEAARHWLKGSPLAKDASHVAALQGDLAAVERAYGKLRSYGTIHTVDLTHSIRLIYMGVHLEDGPLFMRFLIFKRQRGDWIVSEVDTSVRVDPLLTPLLGNTGR